MKSFFRDKSLFQQFAISFIITIFLPISVIGGISYLKGTYQMIVLPIPLAEVIPIDRESR